MANRAQFWVRIVCSNKRCGQEGDAEWAENEKASHGLDRALISLSDGFSRKMGDVRRDPDLICDTCQAVTYVSQSDLDTAPLRPTSTRVAIRSMRRAAAAMLGQQSPALSRLRRTQRLQTRPAWADALRSSGA